MCIITVPPREGKNTSWIQLTCSCNPIDQLLVFFFHVNFGKTSNETKPPHIVPVKRSKGMLFEPFTGNIVSLTGAQWAFAAFMLTFMSKYYTSLGNFFLNRRRMKFQLTFKLYYYIQREANENCIIRSVC